MSTGVNVMIKPLPMIALLMLTTGGIASAEPQGGFPAQRERAAKTQAPDDPRNDVTKKDEVQQRQDEMARRDNAVTKSICKGC
jgi:hypothetical protein